MERQTELPEFVVPDWAVFLTGGVDVQENSLYWTIRAWGPYITSQCIAHGQALGFEGITEAMNTEYLKADGSRLIVSLALIDSGYNADATYDYCDDDNELVGSNIRIRAWNEEEWHEPLVEVEE